MYMDLGREMRVGLPLRVKENVFDCHVLLS